jgi:chemotaxis receptor (MCP) glutamine deamidase CheD
MIRIRNISHHAEVVKVSLGTVRLPHQNHIRIYTGDVATSTTPVVLETILGSCVAVCLFDPVLCAGGMNHILLPGNPNDPRSTRFGVNAMELLINELMKQGGDRSRFIAKAFGGASIVEQMHALSIGSENARFVREFLATEKIPLRAQRLGGTQPVHLNFRTDTGKATIHTVDGSDLHNVVWEEETYRRTHSADKYSSGEITIF